MPTSCKAYELRIHSTLWSELVGYPIRAFTDNEKRTMYERQNGICPMCAAEGKDKHWEIEEMHADHKIPWSRGGHTTLDNGQMLCRDHNLQKSDI